MVNKIDIMRLLTKEVSQDDIARRLGCSKTTVSKCARIMREHGIEEQALADLDEGLVRQSFFPAPERVTDEVHVQLDFESVCKRIESNRKLTLKEIWFQYITNDPNGKKLYSYPQFCRKFRDWAKSSEVTSRMNMCQVKSASLIGPVIRGPPQTA